MRCNAKSKRTGQQCQQYAMHGSTKCYHHGGKSSRTNAGIGNGNWKDGRHSKSLPTRLAARYEDAQTDTKLLELRDEIALTDTRISELLQRVDTGESGQLWKESIAAYNRLKAAKKKAAANAALAELDRLLTAGHTDSQAWAEVYELIEQRRKLVDTERKHMVAMQQMVTVESAMNLAAALLASIKANVSDKAALVAISADFQRLTTIEEQE